MPTIYDNMAESFLEGLRRVLDGAVCASFCVGYLHLWGWRLLADWVERLPGRLARPPCRILVGMHRPPEEVVRQLQGLAAHREVFTAERLLGGGERQSRKEQILKSFRRQLEFGIPRQEAAETLRQLAGQLRAQKVHIKAFLRYPLHAKLYLVEREDPVARLVGFVGSSNFTQPGLTGQGELNVDILDQDAAGKLAEWFERLWQDNLALDISQELAELIEHSWACQQNVRPYLIYLKMAYHLSEEARRAEREFKLPAIFSQQHTPLADFQVPAVVLAARYLYERGGVLLGDVVGVGKTLMATAIARILQEDGTCPNTLVICPPKLVPMWQQYIRKYQITGEVISLGEVQARLPNLLRYRLLIIDESHNLRNREGKRYRTIQDYIERNECRVLLVTATPFNKQYEDLSNQLRLFVDEDQDLGVRPERFFQQEVAQGRTEADFRARFQALPTSLRAFEQSQFPEDWQDLMRLFLVRRTRSFIIRHYAKYDPQNQRYYILLNGQPQYFPVRQPRTLGFAVQDDSPFDPYARLLSSEVVSILEALDLPRYGLAKYLRPQAEEQANAAEKRIIANLTRAGRRLIGFCRTSLFKRLESSGYSFLLSVRRHIVRNLVTLYALENDLPVPIGVQDVGLLDPAISDQDAELLGSSAEEPHLENTPVSLSEPVDSGYDLQQLRRQAKLLYHQFQQTQGRFQWLDGSFFTQQLREALEADVAALKQILDLVPVWDPVSDQKLAMLLDLLQRRHPKEKVLIFTQYADTAYYLGQQLRRAGIADLEVVTAETPNPFELARRFSPSVNGGLPAGQSELRILVATDVLAEGQNLQDCYIVVNYDLPWAIIRLIQRAGRVDRIGQRHDTIFVYSFLPSDGVERMIRLRRRLFERLQINQEVIGTDECFFGEQAENALRDLYAEKPGILDDDPADQDIDLASLALQVWNSASEADRKAALALPPMVSTTAPLQGEGPPGMIAYLRFSPASSEGRADVSAALPPDQPARFFDTLVRVDAEGRLVSQSISAIFRAAACGPDTPALPPADNHYQLLSDCVNAVRKEKHPLGGHLGSGRSVARRVYERLKAFREKLSLVLGLPEGFGQDLDEAITKVYRYPLKEAAQDRLRRQLRLGIPDDELARLVVEWAKEGTLCEILDTPSLPEEPSILCALGFRSVDPVDSERIPG
ncbi:MAG: helicase-related protein [Thermoguttaceae bacterium]|nr:helicase-related protein [Thermoguttaceae bacterium]MDW8039150.1 helicase-related protein [Thermoguttaceae bacterium]